MADINDYATQILLKRILRALNDLPYESRVKPLIEARTLIQREYDRIIRKLG